MWLLVFNFSFDFDLCTPSAWALGRLDPRALWPLGAWQACGFAILRSFPFAQLRLWVQNRWSKVEITTNRNVSWASFALIGPGNWGGARGWSTRLLRRVTCPPADRSNFTGAQLARSRATMAAWQQKSRNKLEGSIIGCIRDDQIPNSSNVSCSDFDELYLMVNVEFGIHDISFTPGWSGRYNLKLQVLAVSTKQFRSFTARRDLSVRAFQILIFVHFV